MVPKAGKAAGSKRQWTAADGALEERAPVAKASKKGRSWIDWQLSNCDQRESAALSTPQLMAIQHNHCIVQAHAESLLADLLTEESWRKLVDVESKRPYFESLESFLKKELDTKTVFPPRQHILRALNELPVSKVKVVIIGQVRVLCSIEPS